MRCCYWCGNLFVGDVCPVCGLKVIDDEEMDLCGLGLEIADNGVRIEPQPCQNEASYGYECLV